MSDIVITGSTDVIGRRAVRELLAAGYVVTGVTLSAGGRERLAGLGAGAIEADVLDEASRVRRGGRRGQPADPHPERRPHGRPVSLGGERPPADRGVGGDRTRRQRAPARAGVDRVRVRRRRRRLARRGRADRRRQVTTTALTAEQNARDLFGGDTVVPRFGLFTGPDSGSTLATLEAARGGASGPPGAYWPMLWLDDAATAIAATVRVPAGMYNVADTDPPTNVEIDAALAAAGVGPLHPQAPQDGPLARSQRVSSRRLREASGHDPPTVALGINIESRCRHVGPGGGDHCH